MNKGASTGEILLIIVMFSLLVFPWIFIGLWWWFWFFLSVATVFVIWEVLAAKVGGKTLSRMFWTWSTKKVDGKRVNLWKAYVILGCLLGGWMMLLIHLAWKMWFSV